MRAIEEIMNGHEADCSVVKQLHDVPPYEVYEVTVDGRRAVCKLDAHPEGSAAVEGTVQRFVDRTTSLPVPTVFEVEADYFLMDYSDDVPDPDGNDNPVQWARQAGAGMARLHEETALDSFGFPQGVPGRRGESGVDLPLEEYATWPEIARAFLERRRRYLRTYGHDLGVEAADAVLDLFENAPELLGATGDPVLCHGNWLIDHVGVDEDDLTAVIDFEHALVAPPCYDYWRTALPMFGEEGVEERFRAGYESVRPLPEAVVENGVGYRLLNLVSYFRSLYLQDQRDEAAKQEWAERTHEHVLETVDELR